MDPKELKRIFSRGKCLSLDTMRMYNEGNLPSKSVHEVERHLLECSLCASAIEGINSRRIKDVDRVSGNINKRLAVYMNTPPSTPILSRFGVAMIVTGLVLAIGITAWMITANSDHPEKESADTNPVVTHQPPSEQHQTNNIPESTGERSQENGTVSVPDHTIGPPSKQEQKSLTTANLPATQPGNEKTLSVDPEKVSGKQNEETPPPAQTDNTRNQSAEQFVRIKSVMVYPATTHSDKKTKSGGGNDGQLDRSSGSKSDFELDEMPTYPGGNEALKSYIIANFKPQKEDKSKLKRYTTGVLFQVNAKTGEVSGASLSFPVTPALDAELLRVMNAMPYWNPGKKRGVVDVMVGITFE